MGRELESHKDHGLALEESRPEVTLPPMYRVILLNDDYTPMDFVIEILKVFFNMSHDRATQVMLHVHTRGKQGGPGQRVFPAKRAPAEVHHGESLNLAHDRAVE
jgi:hypothetical protein